MTNANFAFVAFLLCQYFPTNVIYSCLVRHLIHTRFNISIHSTQQNGPILWTNYRTTISPKCTVWHIKFPKFPGVISRPNFGRVRLPSSRTHPSTTFRIKRPCSSKRPRHIQRPPMLTRVDAQGWRLDRPSHLMPCILACHQTNYHHKHLSWLGDLLYIQFHQYTIQSETATEDMYVL